jgi:LemA protein
VKKSTIVVLSVIGVVVVLALIIGGSIAGGYNNIVSAKETVSNAKAKIEAQYQRRYDLIPQLVNTVKGAADKEQKTLTDVIEARSNATGIKLGDNPSDETLKRVQDAQSQLTGSLSRLLAVSEAYPTLQSQQRFADLQAQLEGTANRITVAQNDYNDAARQYNTLISRFPSNIVAGITGQNQRVSYFEAKTGADEAPEVNFGDDGK